MGNAYQVKQISLRRRQIWGRTLACGVTVLVAGCATVVPKGVPEAPPPPVVTPPPVTNELPTDTGRHRIALLVPLNGTYGGAGQAIANAANMAVLDTGGQSLRVTTYDTSAGSAAAARKALNEGTQLILGPLLADDVRAVAPAARAAHVPVVSFSNDSSAGGNGIWIMGFAPSQAIGRVVSYAAEKGVTKLAGLAPSNVYGQRASTLLLRAAEANGGQIVSMQSYDHSPASMSSAIKKLKLGSPFSGILIADSGKEAVKVAPLIRRSGATSARIMGTELWNVDHSLGQTPALIGAWYASVSDGLFNQLATKYRTRFGKAPPRVASLGYDAVLLAAKIAPDWKSGAAFPVSKLLDKGGFTGIDGVFRFTREGTAERGLQVNQVTANGVTVVSPAPQSLGN
jgi:ABC-type branched-subunit amino acid transport system substrate-binding protein